MISQKKLAEYKDLLEDQNLSEPEKELLVASLLAMSEKLINSYVESL